MISSRHSGVVVGDDGTRYSVQSSAIDDGDGWIRSVDDGGWSADLGTVAYRDQDFGLWSDSARSRLRRTEVGVLFQFGQLVAEVTAAIRCLHRGRRGYQRPCHHAGTFNQTQHANRQETMKTAGSTPCPPPIVRRSRLSRSAITMYRRPEPEVPGLSGSSTARTGIADRSRITNLRRTGPALNATSDGRGTT
jgi:hypothetical protein